MRPINPRSDLSSSLALSREEVPTAAAPPGDAGTSEEQVSVDGGTGLGPHPQGLTDGPGDTRAQRVEQLLQTSGLALPGVGRSRQFSGSSQASGRSSSSRASSAGSSTGSTRLSTRSYASSQASVRSDGSTSPSTSAPQHARAPWGSPGASRQAPDQARIRRAVAADFILDVHMPALEQASREGRFAVTFRAAGAATLRALAQGAGAKGHDVLEKTVKHSSVLKAYPERGEALLQQLRAAGVEGCVGHWDKKTRALVGLYLTDPSPEGHRRIHPIDVDNLEGSLAELKVRPQWRRELLSGDYDMHDMIVFAGAGRPRTPLVGSKEERRVIERLNAAVARVDPQRPLEDRERNVVRHGPQVNFPSFMLSREAAQVQADGGFLGAVARPGEFPIAALDRGTWTLIEDVHGLEQFYQGLGARIKESWHPDGARAYAPVDDHPGMVKLGRPGAPPGARSGSRSGSPDQG